MEATRVVDINALLSSSYVKCMEAIRKEVLLIANSSLRITIIANKTSNKCDRSFEFLVQKERRDLRAPTTITF